MSVACACQIYGLTGNIFKGRVYLMSGTLITTFKCDGATPWLNVARSVARVIDAGTCDITLLVGGTVVDVTRRVDSGALGTDFEVQAIPRLPVCSLCCEPMTSPRQVCGGCRLAAYCSPSCQLGDYKNHRALCKGVRITMLAAAKNHVECGC